MIIKSNTGEWYEIFKQTKEEQYEKNHYGFDGSFHDICVNGMRRFRNIRNHGSSGSSGGNNGSGGSACGYKSSSSGNHGSSGDNRDNRSGKVRKRQSLQCG